MSVPVLSTTSVVARASVSSASAFRTSTPAVAPRPTPTMTDIGVARPSAQGQAMISTETAATSAWAKRGSGPTSAQATNASAATATTAGTNQAAMRSARRWIGARLRCASLTSATMRASSVSRPTRSARITKPPVPLSVAPVTGAPGPFATGIGSPLIIDSSTLVWPSSTTPSVGTRSPGRTRRRSPGRTRVERHVGLACRPPRAGARCWAPGRRARGSRRRCAGAPRARAPGPAAPA